MSITTIENVGALARPDFMMGAGTAEQELQLDLRMAALIAEIDEAFTPEDEVALDQKRAHKSDSKCDSPTQEWVE